MKPNDIPPHEQLMRYLVGMWISKPLYVVAELGIADLLADGPKSICELARTTRSHEPHLSRVLRALASVGIFRETEDDRFELTPIAACLRAGAMRSIALLLQSDWADRAWGCLLEAVRSGGTPFELAHGVPVTDWLEEHPRAANVFQDANAVKAAGSLSAIVKVYDFSGLKTLVDVGGGLGVLIAEILTAHPAMNGIVAERSSVVPFARETVEGRGVASRCRVEACDFFESVPAGGDGYLLSNVLHDWPDERCRVILENCRRVMREGAKLLIVEMIVPVGNGPSIAKLMDLEMLVTTGGRERTEREFEDLLSAAGFAPSRIVPVGGDIHLIEATARSGTRGS